MSRLSGLRFQPFRVVYKGSEYFLVLPMRESYGWEQILEGGKKLTDLSQKVVSQYQRCGHHSRQTLYTSRHTISIEGWKIKSGKYVDEVP